MELHCALRTAGRGYQAQYAVFFGRRKCFLLVRRRNAAHIGLDPNLQKMGGGIGRVVELAVLHAGARAHALHIAWRYAFDIAHIVFVRKVARQHVADDLHVPVAMGAKPGTGRDAVFIDHPQIAPAHESRVVITRKGKTMKGFEPAMVGVAAVTGFA